MNNFLVSSSMYCVVRALRLEISRGLTAHNILGKFALRARFLFLLHWFKLVYGPFGQSNMHHNSSFAYTSQEGIKCTKAKE